MFKKYQYKIPLLLLLILISLNLAKSQKINDLIIGVPVKGRMEIDESHKYFKLVLPESIKGKLLQITTRQNKEEEIDTDEPFSDPDVYISKENKYPSSPRSSEWYSERYGSDVLTIPSEALSPGDILYLGVYCQFKCRYYLNITEDKESEMKLGEYNFISLGSHQTVNYKLYIEKDFEELNVVSYSNNGKFRIFMNKKAPSSQNTFNVIPSWKNGYVFQVRQENEKQYCSNCYYHIVIYNDGEESINSLTLYSYLPDKIFNLKPEVPLYDAVEKQSKRCYSYDIKHNEKKEKLIIQTTMFSGNLMLVVYGWAPGDNDIKYNLRPQTNYTYRMVSEQFTILNENDFDYFDSQKTIFQGKDSTLYFCYYSAPESSFSINVYFLSKVENVQAQSKANILTPSHKLRTYLLKGQFMKYELMGFNLEKNNVETNITVSTSNVVGTTKLYGYFCKEEKCLINKEIIKTLKETDNLLSAVQKDYEVNILEIPYEENKCYKNPKITLKNKNVVECVPIIGVLCDKPNEKGLCVFDIQLSISDIPLMMKQKQMYYGTIPLGKIDYYEIMITDENIHSLVVVLNSESGDAELLFYRKGEISPGKKEGQLISLSYHNDYIPDVVRITPEKIKRENLVGNYLVKVSATCYSNYNIYYYVIYNKDKNQEKKNKIIPEVTMNIEIGQVVTDYFPNDIRYKIYSFTPLTEKQSNLKVFLDRVNVDFTIYVYSDISKFKILQMYEIEQNREREPISGYDWKSEGSNEVTILRNDPRFNPDQMYYIVIAPNLPKEPGILKKILDFFRRFPNQYNQEDIMDKKAPIKLYLGVTEVNEQITISEGMPHTLTLTSNYSGQNYFYEHYDTDQEFQLDINVLMGEIDIFIDVKEINLKKLKGLDLNNSDVQLQHYGSMIYKTGINENFETIVLDKEYLKKYKNNDNNGIKLYFYICRSQSAVEDDIECKYSITQKSSNIKGEFLQPGLIKNSRLEKGKKHYYIIEEVKKRKGGGVIKVNFDGGSGNVYVKIPKTPEVKNIRFPSIGEHDYMGEMVFSGKIVKIPEECYDRLNSETLSLQILVTVEAGSGSESFDDIKDFEENRFIKKEQVYYSISYSNEPKTISQNVPYDGYITKGEVQYFTFYFDENVNNIYFGLYNMNGDVDMYLNYGLSLPTPIINNWKTTDLSHEYIDLNKDDPFFKKNELNSVSGYYTLLIEGFTNSSFSLFVSTHNQKVLPLRNNKPVVCNCKTKGDKCFLRYNEVFDKENKKKGILQNAIIFTTQYLYGNGKMYAKLFKDSEIHGEDFYKYFPNEKDYDMSNKESNQRNYMKMRLEESKYSEDSAILMTFICEEKTQVDISATRLRHYSSVDYIQENKENVFYIGMSPDSSEQPELKLYFNHFFFNRNDFIYSIHSYVGDAHFKIYANDSRWDISQQKEVFDYHLFKEFDIVSNNEANKDNIEVYNPYNRDYHNFITAEQYRGHQNFVFQVLPKNEFGFYIQCNYEKEWNELSIGKSKSFYARRNNFYGYFDIVDDYSDIELAFSIDRNILLSADLYVKINIIDTTKKVKVKEGQNINEMSLYHYLYPSPENYDYYMPSDETLGTISLNMNNLPKLKPEEKSTKFIRGLIYVRLKEENFEPIQPFGDGSNRHGGPHGRHGWHHGQRTWEENEENLPVITIMLTPGVQLVKYVDANPHEYYFSNTTYGGNMTREPENKIYTLYIQNEDDDVLIIEISSCYGSYQASITDILDNAGQPNSDKDLDIFEQNRDGKKVIYVSNLKSKTYYLTIRAKISDYMCHLKYKHLYYRDHPKEKYKMFNRGFNQTNDEFSKNMPKECSNDLSYLMYYYTIKKIGLKYTTDLMRFLIHTPYGNGKIRIKVPTIIKRDILNNNLSIEDYKFAVFATKNEDYYNKMGSICYLSQYKNQSENEIFKVKDVKHEDGKYLVISGLGYREKYYINVVAQSTTSKELIAFQPFVMWTGGYLPFPIWQTALVSNIIIIILVVFLVIFIRKYCVAKKELKEIKGDTLPKMESEVSGTTEDRVQYSGLGSSY